MSVTLMGGANITATMVKMLEWSVKVRQSYIVH